MSRNNPEFISESNEAALDLLSAIKSYRLARQHFNNLESRAEYPYNDIANIVTCEGLTSDNLSEADVYLVNALALCAVNQYESRERLAEAKKLKFTAESQLRERFLHYMGHEVVASTLPWAPYRTIEAVKYGGSDGWVEAARGHLIPDLLNLDVVHLDTSTKRRAGREFLIKPFSQAFTELQINMVIL